ncbi:MAG: type II toxin-antitoxin system RelE/ParE family toxin [Spirosomataceae bacterium]
MLLRNLPKNSTLLPNDLENLILSLEQNPKQGADLGSGLYKIRLASGSKGKGKSGGFRVITYVVYQKIKRFGCLSLNFV